jgi:hypothetical protein
MFPTSAGILTAFSDLRGVIKVKNVRYCAFVGSSIIDKFAIVGLSLARAAA